MQIKSKFSGRCTSCGGTIQQGETVEWTRGEGVAHVGKCPEQASLSSNGDKLNASTVGMGVYRKDGKIFVVKPNKEKTRCYAKEIVASPPRMTEHGEQVDFETVYRAGVIYQLTEADKWPLKEAAAFLTQYARCIVCGRHLKAAQSVRNSIGPICAGYFA
jgi:predicted RNA-binding Zn-ribbon protein involved in translation (DUF1610 family)